MKYEVHNRRNKDTRRRWHSKLVITKIETGEDSDDVFLFLYKYRNILKEMGQKVHDYLYEDIIL